MRGRFSPACRLWEVNVRHRRDTVPRNRPPAARAGHGYSGITRVSAFVGCLGPCLPWIRRMQRDMEVGCGRGRIVLRKVGKRRGIKD